MANKDREATQLQQEFTSIKSLEDLHEFRAGLSPTERDALFPGKSEEEIKAAFEKLAEYYAGTAHGQPKAQAQDNRNTSTIVNPLAGLAAGLGAGMGTVFGATWDAMGKDIKLPGIDKWRIGRFNASVNNFNGAKAVVDDSIRTLSKNAPYQAFLSRVNNHKSGDSASTVIAGMTPTGKYKDLMLNLRSIVDNNPDVAEAMDNMSEGMAGMDRHGKETIHYADKYRNIDAPGLKDAMNRSKAIVDNSVTEMVDRTQGVPLTTKLPNGEFGKVEEASSVMEKIKESIDKLIESIKNLFRVGQ